MRTALLIAPLLCFAGCGTVCDEVAAAERDINTKGMPCNSTNHGVRDTTRCNNGLSKCSPDDVKALDSYAKCLNMQPVCDSSTSLSWGLAVAGCVQPLGNVSFACSSAIQ
jgi:hypothetical protein